MAIHVNIPILEHIHVNSDVNQVRLPLLLHVSMDYASICDELDRY